MAVNRKWKEEYEQLKEKYRTDLRKLQEEVGSLNHKLEESNTHILALESENMRLAETLTGENISTRTSVNDPDNELVRFQMQAYKDDFSCERRDRERAQNDKESIHKELKSAQEIIATLMEEVCVFS
jgi:chromosome segregation ATPase